VYHDAATPDRLIGFEAELAEALAARLGVKAQMAQENWDMLVPGLKKNSFDIILNGLERTPENQQKVRIVPALFCLSTTDCYPAGFDEYQLASNPSKARRLGCSPAPCLFAFSPPGLKSTPKFIPEMRKRSAI